MLSLRTLLLALVLVTAALSPRSAPATTTGHDPAGTYATDTYHPLVFATGQADPTLTAQTQQICTTDGQALILHTLTATAANRPYQVDLRLTDTYAQVSILRGTATRVGSVLAWTPASPEATLVVSLSQGPCVHAFPEVFLIPFTVGR